MTDADDACRSGGGVHSDDTPPTSDTQPSSSPSRPLRIPAIAHFIWYGANFPWVNALAVRSALQRGGFTRVVLHAEQNLASAPHARDLLADPAFELRAIEPQALLSSVTFRGPALHALHASLSSPAARANLLRAAILAAEGGVYLDMDTITLRSLEPLRSAGVFCGYEQIAFPVVVARARGSLRWWRACALHGARALCRHHPDGIALFGRLSQHFALAVNNAVLAAAPGHPLVLGLLRAMLELPPALQQRRFALGTHLLQTELERYQAADLCVHPPRVFYPLPPEISQHWFRTRQRADLSQVIAPDTRVVHWYASTENRAFTERIDPSYVRAHADTQLFSALALPFVP